MCCPLLVLTKEDDDQHGLMFRTVAPIPPYKLPSNLFRVEKGAMKLFSVVVIAVIALQVVGIATMAKAEAAPPGCSNCH